MNKNIRNSIMRYINYHGATETRVLIALMAARFGVPKQQISGNLSYMICREGTLNLVSNKPHSYVCL